MAVVLAFNANGEDHESVSRLQSNQAHICPNWFQAHLAGHQMQFVLHFFFLVRKKEQVWQTYRNAVDLSSWCARRDQQRCHEGQLSETDTPGMTTLSELIRTERNALWTIRLNFCRLKGLQRSNVVWSRTQMNFSLCLDWSSECCRCSQTWIGQMQKPLAVNWWKDFDVDGTDHVEWNGQQESCLFGPTAQMVDPFLWHINENQI